MSNDSLITHCETLSLQLGRLGAFVEMSYRLFPHTRNSFTPNLLELGFNFEEMRQVTDHTALRFQIFPNTFVTPLKKALEDLRGDLRSLDQGPFNYMGAPFLTHEDLALFHRLVASKRSQIQTMLHNEMIENYDKLRERAYKSLKATFETLLPRLGISNTQEVLSGPSWFGNIFPDKTTLTGDFKLNVYIFNVHPNALISSDLLRKEVEHFIVRPKQLPLFDSSRSLAREVP